MVSTSTALMKANNNCSIKLPHGLSQPVIFKEKNRYYLAFFVFFVTKKDLDEGYISRPSLWILSDIETGKIVEVRKTSEKEFSDASYQCKYNIAAGGPYNNSKDYYVNAFSILDTVREEIVQKKSFNTEKYKEYMLTILKNNPIAYQRFYNDLSVNY